ncbi:MAG TPA: LmeA family phospholipid-binding protein [Nannocystaceae bacterium]|nr:LmeA family phospholipid-binding protein [Nannocystaceae bacterium]
MKKLGIVLALVGVLLVIALAVGWYLDGKARALAEAEAEKRVLEALPGTRSAKVEIEGFPFLFDVLVSGEIDRLHVVLQDVASPGIVVESIELTVDRLKIDSDLLIGEQKLAITGIGRAEVVGRITAEAASAALKQRVEFDGDTVRVEVAGTKAAAKVAIAGRKIAVDVDTSQMPAQYAHYAPRYVVPLPPVDVLPCEPGLAVKRSRLELRCSITELPPSVKKAIGQR